MKFFNESEGHCKCSICTMARRYRKLKPRMTRRAKEFVEGLMNAYVEQSEELELYRLKYDKTVSGKK